MQYRCDSYILIIIFTRQISTIFLSVGPVDLRSLYHNYTHTPFLTQALYQKPKTCEEIFPLLVKKQKVRFSSTGFTEKYGF